MLRHIFNLFLLTAIFALNSNAQLDKTGKKALKKARSHLFSQEFIEAKEQYRIVIEQDDKDPIILFEAGLAFYKSEIKPEEGIPLLEKALELSTDTLSENLLYLAKAYHHNNEFLKAKKYYGLFLNHYLVGNKNGIAQRENVARWVKMCENGESFAMQEKPTIITNMTRKVNSQYHEYAPVIDPNEKIIYYTSRRPGGVGDKVFYDNLPYEDVYFTKDNEGEWSLAQNINKNKEIESNGFNDKRHDATVNISSDGKTLFLYKDNEIWQSNKNESGAWEEPIKMNNNINFGDFTPSVFLTSDQKELYIVSFTEEGFGKKDIYVSTLNDNNEWTEPQNLGDKINTEVNEDAPFITPDNQTMYFSSEGHNSIGGYDIFKSVKNSDGTWGEPVNLGMPINSGGHDIYYVEFKNKNQAIYASNRTGSEGFLDLYMAKFDCDNLPSTRVRGIAMVEPYGFPAEGTVTVYNQANGETVGTFEVDPNSGQYTMILPPDNKYYLEFALSNANLPRAYKENFEIPKQCDEYDLFQDVSIDHFTDEEGQLTASEAHFTNAFFDVDKEILATETSTLIDNSEFNLLGSVQHGSSSKADYINVYLLNEDWDIVKVSKTNNEGTFTFKGVDTTQQYKIMLDNTQLLVSQFGENFDSFQSEFKADGKIQLQHNDVNLPYKNAVVFTSIDLKSSQQESKTDNKGYYILDMNSKDESVKNQISEATINKNLTYTNNDEILSAHIKFYGEDDSLNITRYTDRIEISKQLENLSSSEEFNNLLFDFDKYVLREKSKSILNNLASFIEQHPEVDVTFSGHTDWIGSDAYNMTLSENRSKSAEKYMVEKGIDKKQITLEWHGESKPAVPNANPDGSDNEENRQLNRRVEIKISIPETAELIISL